jgi:GNAT superfamily N-acetyltransferase
MDNHDILKLLDAERRSLCRDGEVIEILPHVTRLRPDDGAYHCVIFSELSPTTADEVIAEQVGHYRRLGTGFEWKVYNHDRPPDLRERLGRHGFAVGQTEAVLVLDLQDAATWIDGAAPCDVMRIERAEQVELFREVAEEIFGKDYGTTAGQLMRAIERGSTQHLAYSAVVDGTAASIGRLYTHPDSAFGGLYGGGTRPAFRGQGLYRAVVAARARDARELGARFLVVDAMPTSRPILERLGFRHVADTWPCTWEP